jgi:hypothetical protein
MRRTFNFARTWDEDCGIVYRVRVWLYLKLLDLANAFHPGVKLEDIKPAMTPRERARVAGAILAALHEGTLVY